MFFSDIIQSMKAMNPSFPVLIVGLGNPKPEYALTRHNAGFIAVDVLAGPDAVWKKLKNALVAKFPDVIFAKPQTYMNNSGIAVAALMAYYKIPIENVVVIHDDMDIRVGDIRQKIGGGSAGHNGIKSIDDAIGNDYRRVRIGIGHPRDVGLPIDPSDWVLARFTDAELEKILKLLRNFNSVECGV